MADSVATTISNPAVSQDGSTLVGSRCPECGSLFFPVGSVCPSCLNGELDRVPLSRQGNLYTYSIIHIGPRGWDTPYAVGYVDLPEGVRLFAHLAVTDFSVLKPDLPVEVDAFPIDGPNSERGITYCFKAAPMGDTRDA